MHGLPLKQFFPTAQPTREPVKRKITKVVNMRKTTLPRSSMQKKTWAMTPPTVENNVNYHINTPAPKLHIFANMAAPGDRRESLMRPPRHRHDRAKGSKLNCYQRGHGGNGTIRLFMRDRNGRLNKETDC